jgi:hypothetical protein
MDCKTARLFLPFYRPAAGDLDGPEAEELEQHLAHCSECNALASAQRRLDQHIGRAMRTVEAPAGLRKEILNRLAEQRRKWYRRWFGQAAWVGIAAGLLLAASVVWYLWDSLSPRRISPEEVAYALNVTPPDRDSANAALKRLGAGAYAPAFVKYAYLTGSPTLAELPGYKGVKVPQLVFTQYRDRARGAERVAVIYVLEDRRFRIEEVDRADSGQLHVELYPHNVRHKATYLVLYSGDSWDWLKLPEPVE